MKFNLDYARSLVRMDLPPLIQVVSRPSGDLPQVLGTYERTGRRRCAGARVGMHKTRISFCFPGGFFKSVAKVRAGARLHSYIHPDETTGIIEIELHW